MKSHYFVIGKIISLILFLGYQIANGHEHVMEKALLGLLLACFITATTLLEVTEGRKKRIAELIMEGILTGLGVFLFPVTGCLMLMVLIGDFCSVLRLKKYGYFFIFLGIIPYAKMGGELVVGFMIAFFIAAVYIQEKVVIEGYLSTIGIEEATQQELKSDIENQDISHKREMKKSRLAFENQMLEDRNRISQALHDKLGHSINGSIYQLEAAKLLVDKKPEDCKKILQGVIDQLRLSMDEIRAILRSERPDKKRMTFLALNSLCEECESKYGIEAHLNIEDEDGVIPEAIWEVILDNTYEAVTNALKYANCYNIFIDIIAMNEIVRCTIRDDGRGAETVEDGMGLAGMKNRVRAVKGFIDIEHEAGFTINMILPLEKDR